MGFDINSFIGQINGVNGLMTKSFFSVQINPPTGLNNTTGAQLLQFLTESTVLPGMGLDTVGYKRHGYGLVEQRAINTAFPPINFNFYVDGQGNALQFFTQWMQLINNFNPATGQSSATNGLKLYDFQYPDQYQSTIQIQVYDSANNNIVQYTLNEAYPSAIEDMGFTWDSNGDIQKLAIKFVYRWWTSNNQGSTAQAGSGAGQTTAQSTQQGASASLPFTIPNIGGNIAKAVAATLQNPASIGNVIPLLNQNFYRPFVQS